MTPMRLLHAVLQSRVKHSTTELPEHTSIFINSFFASGNICRLLINFANSLDPDQDRQNVGSDLDPNVLHPDGVPERIFEKVNFEESH